MRERHGMAAHFYQGACGDINPSACSWDEPRDSADGTRELQRLGRTMADRLDAMLEGIESLPSSRLHCMEMLVAVPTAELSRDFLRAVLRDSGSAAARGASGGGAKMAALRIHWAAGLLEQLERGRYPKRVEVPVHMVRIGEAVFVGIAAELFSQVGLGVKEGLGRARTFVCAYANGCVGYIASERSYDCSEYGADTSAALYGIPLLAKEAGTVLAAVIVKAAAAGFR